jgi:hypothetical protein
MTLSYNNNTPLASQTVASTQAPILTNFQSIDSAFNAPVGGVTGGGNFCSYSLQATTTSFTAKPINPIGVLSTVASTNGNPELAWINNVNATGAGPYNGTQLTGGGVTSAAYISFSGTTGTALAGAYNATSSRGGVGIYTVVFPRNFANTNYIAIITPNFLTSANSFKIININKAVGSLGFVIQNQTAAFADPTNLDVVCFGILV